MSRNTARPTRQLPRIRYGRVSMGAASLTLLATKRTIRDAFQGLDLARVSALDVALRRHHGSYQSRNSGQSRRAVRVTIRAGQADVGCVAVSDAEQRSDVTSPRRITRAPSPELSRRPSSCHVARTMGRSPRL